MSLVLWVRLLGSAAPTPFLPPSGIIGGLSPLAVAAIKANLPQASHSFAPAIWLVCLGGISVFGAIGLRLYDPRLNRKHVGRLD